MTIKPESRDIPIFEKPIEVRLALQMGGRVLKFDQAKVMSQKMKWGRDLKTFISSFQVVVKKSELSPEFLEFTSQIETDVSCALAYR